jgi:hypothetical protein
MTSRASLIYVSALSLVVSGCSDGSLFGADPLMVYVSRGALECTVQSFKLPCEGVAAHLTGKLRVSLSQRVLVFPVEQSQASREDVVAVVERLKKAGYAEATTIVAEIIE